MIPKTAYDYEVARIVAVYKRAMSDILRELERVDLSDFTRAKYTIALREVSAILAGVDEYSGKWIERNIPIAARNGIADTVVALGYVKTLPEAQKIASFSRMNKTLIDAVIADTKTDLLAVTTNVSRKVRTTMRRVTGEVMRANAAMGVLGRKTNNRDIIANLYDQLGDAVDTGIIDAAGRRWRPETYVDVVTRTSLTNAHIEATTNEAVSRGAFYGVISTHGATDACAKWEGAVVKLVPNAPGPYPTVAEAKASGEIWHPCCGHTISALRDPELLNK